MNYSSQGVKLQVNAQAEPLQKSGSRGRITVKNSVGPCGFPVGSTVGGDGGCSVSEVRTVTTSPIPDHKGFKQHQLSEIHPFHF